MNPDQALNLATRVEGLFAETTPLQVSFLADQFAAFDHAVAEREVTRFRRQFETLNIANLLRRITEEQQKRAIPRNDHRGERRKVDAQWQRDDAALAKLSDAELTRRKQALLDQRPDLRPFLANKNPRDSLILRSLILEQRPSKR